MAEIEIDYTMDPVERLKLEMSANKEPFYQAIGKYMLEQFTLDIGLKNAYFERKLTLKQVVDYINDCAHKKLDGHNGAIEDTEVFGWVIHFIQDEKVEITNANSYKITKEDEEEAKKRALEKFERAELERLEEEKEAKEEAEKKKYEKAVAKEKADREASGQMSIFEDF